MQNAANISYKYGFAAQDWFQYPGGLYKAASTTEFPASTSMSGGLFKLNKGGMREMHWHNPNEWAFVMNGTCRATLVNQGSTHMVESCKSYLMSCALLTVGFIMQKLLLTMTSELPWGVLLIT